MNDSFNQLISGPPQLADIDEKACIGCTKCITACPVDAILGAAKQMHVIIPELCIGCEQCVEPCPVDCITMLPLPKKTYTSNVARAHYEKKLKRTQDLTLQKHQAHEKKRAQLAKKQYILSALARVKQKRT